MQPMKTVTIYTDGGAQPNPGPGGYGVVLRYGEHQKELSGGFRLTTNNRMEILAAVVALEALTRPCQVVLHSDSRYVVDAMSQGWAQRWQRNGWMRNKTDVALNPDLWERLLKAAEPHQVEWRWVKAHVGIADNERCDQLAGAALKRSSLPADGGYEASLQSAQG